MVGHQTRLPIVLTGAATAVDVLGIVWMQEQLDRIPALHNAITPAVGYVERHPGLAVRVYVAIATVYHAVRAPVLVVELSARPHLVAKLVLT